MLIAGQMTPPNILAAQRLIELAVGPTNPADQNAFKQALLGLLQGDESIEADEFGQTILYAVDESRLNAIIGQLQRDFEQRLSIGAPQTSYRAYLTKPVDVDFTHKMQSGSSGQFARVKLNFTPGERGSGIIFNDVVAGGNIPKEYIPSIEMGIRKGAAAESLAGWPIIDFEIKLYDGAYHDPDSSALAFEIAGRGAMSEAAHKSGVNLLEPIMRVVVITPEDFLGDVIGDLNNRRGQIQSADSLGAAEVVEAMVPLANMFGYVNHLRSFTQGRAEYTMQFSHYAPLAPDYEPDDSFPSAAALRA